jgi:UDP-N-acetylmuramoyl-tripeptide--D-alanyl-D-alanine ligase
MERFSLQDLMQVTGGRLREVDFADARFDRISIDSREIRNGDLFWALQGEHHDGHDFANEALGRNARLCVISADRSNCVSGACLIVDETLSALGRFARWHRNRLDALMIGVTGSVGKTTTRELIFAALSGQYHGIRSRKNFNNLIGLPLSLLDLDPSHEFAVMEMGASQIGDIHQLCDLARPEVGVVTAIGPAHLQSFGSLGAIIQTKGELLEQLPSTGFAVLPGDDIVLRQMADRAPCPVIFVGQSDDNQIRATHVEAHPGSLRFRCEGFDFDIPVNGRHTLSNALCAIAIGLEIGISTKIIAAGLTKFTPAPGRGGLVQIGPWTVIDDTYNASPLSVAASCKLLKEIVVPGVGQRLLVLGDMRELGPTAAFEHERIGNLAAELRLDRLLVCGDYAGDVARGAERKGMKSHQIAATNDTETLLTILDCWLEPCDLLLVKGSRSTRMERVIDWLKGHAELGERLYATGQHRICA